MISFRIKTMKWQRSGSIEAGKSSSNHDNGELAVLDRQRPVASLLAQSRNESEIAEKLGVHQFTISRDIQALKEASRQFIPDLAKSDLVFSYQQSI